MRPARTFLGRVAVDRHDAGQGALWRIDASGAAEKMDDGFHICNGLGWSPDDTRMYFTDSGKRKIWVYDYDIEAGRIRNRRLFAETTEETGVPDGLAVDSEGYVWSANWDGWSITRYAPDGQVDKIVSLPVPRPTSCAFGGPDMTTLYITTARIRLSASLLSEAPLSGSVLAVETGVRGQVEPRFAG
jgi:sugar lactone lactonase YvrE